MDKQELDLLSNYVRKGLTDKEIAIEMNYSRANINK